MKQGTKGVPASVYHITANYETAPETVRELKNIKDFREYEFRGGEIWGIRRELTDVDELARFPWGKETVWKQIVKKKALIAEEKKRRGGRKKTRSRENSNSQSQQTRSPLSISRPCLSSPPLPQCLHSHHCLRRNKRLIRSSLWRHKRQAL